MEGIVVRFNALFPERGHLLDVGAGIGVLMQTAAEAGWEVEGIEPAPRPALHTPLFSSF
jgi:2-polyprenyl-3-methyl-5-hydroxy-6-metoxy-1,4-benzoquinol methylase